MVPHLITALSGPLLDLERRFLDANSQIERWFRLEWQEHTPAFYSAVDLRNAGYKLAPVDTSLFPQGFNLLAPEAMPLAQQAAMAAIEKYCPDARHLMLIPARRDLDGPYAQHLLRLAALLRQTGLEVRFGSLAPDLKEARRVPIGEGQSILLEPIIRPARRVGLEGFDPCTIVVNDEMAHDLPAILEGIYEQTLVPPLHAGWAVRRRSQHLAAYQDVVKRFGKALDIDPWLVNPVFARCTEVDWHEASSQQRLAGSVDSVLRQIRSRYREYGIRQTPWVVIKADTGEGGAVITSVRDAAELALRWDSLATRRVRARGLRVEDLIIQEGVPTVETLDDATAEPVVYLIDRYVIGGYYRVQAGRKADEAVLAPGTRLLPLPFAESCHLPHGEVSAAEAPNRFYAYGVVARLAMLAASIELERSDPDQSLYG